MGTPWNNWYHVNGNTYATWLPGSNLGFRTRHHRRHIEGDYKNPPPKGQYQRDLDRSRELMRRRPVFLRIPARRMACAEIVNLLLKDAIEVIVTGVNAYHYHLLARFPDRRPRHWVGRAKGRSAHALSAAGLVELGGVWAKRCLYKPIRNREHQMRVVRYILNHRHEGAATRLVKADELERLLGERGNDESANTDPKPTP